MRLEHHLVGGYVRYISPYIIIIITDSNCIDNEPLVDLIIPIESALTIYKDLLSTSGLFRVDRSC